ncbi:MAG: cyclic nucleotide-binding domain-containing protein [Acidobacteriota bacterium]
MDDTVLPHPSMIDRLVEVARRLRSIRRPAEAAELLDIAAAFSPQGKALREEADRVRSEQGIDDFDREFKRRNLEASHALGMAHIFETRGEFGRAVDMIDLAKLRTPFNYLAYAAAGFLHLRHNDAVTAQEEFIQARRLNPLDFRLAVETSRTALENEDFDAALEAAVDAMLLASWRSDREQQQERRRVETLVRLCQRGPQEVEQLISNRTSVLQKACDNMALSHARIFTGAKTTPRSRKRAKSFSSKDDDLLRRATELRSIGLFRHFSDDSIIPLAMIAKPSEFSDRDVFFSEGETSRDLKIVRQGTVRISRRTPVGSQVLTTQDAGSLFGEVSYLDGKPRSATAYGVGEGSIFTLPAKALDEAVANDQELAVSLLWGFWQTLAAKVRAANAQMSELFGAPAEPFPTERSENGSGDRVHVEEETKINLLREQGLSAQELRLLAKYSRERKYPEGALIFAEGDPGDCLYIVVDGAVRISRMVPGMGEEALIILERGEVFGELALVDDQPRSADARAHRSATTVLAISRSLLEEVLLMDPDAAIQFLNLLSRLLCGRLRAMNERLVAWRVMASHE